jgi:hypothetical protein
MRRYSISAAAALLLMAAPAQAQSAGDQIEKLFETTLGANNGGCVDTVRVSLTDAIRAGIDTEVKRAEAALQQPQPIDALGCLDNLMNVNLDIAVPVPDFQGMFNQALSNAENQICSFAQDAWEKVTEPLTSALQLPSFNGLTVETFSSNPGDVLNFGDVESGLADGDYGENSSGRDAGAGSLLRDTYRKLYGSGGSL